MRWMMTLGAWVICYLFLTNGLSAQSHDDGLTAISWNASDSLGRKNGPWREYAVGEPNYGEFTYRNDTLHGPYQIYSPTGRLLERGHYAYGDRNGRLQRFDGQGKVNEEGCYDEGLKTGIWRTYYPTGKLRTECTYVAGELEGNYTEYSAKGEIIASIPFTDGKRNGRASVQYAGSGRKASQYFQEGRLLLSAVRDEKGKIIEVLKTSEAKQEPLYLSKE